MKVFSVLVAVAVMTLFSANVALAADPAKDACNGAAAIQKERDKARTDSEKAETESEYLLEVAACNEVFAEVLEICPVSPKSVNKECINEAKQELKACLSLAKQGYKAEQQTDKAEAKARQQAAKELKKECLDAI